MVTAQAAIDEMQNTPRFRGQIGIVGDDNEAGLVFVIERQHQIEHALRRVPIEIAGRLVGQDAGGFRD